MTARKVDGIYRALVTVDTATLLGKPAPEHDLKRVGGGRVRLAPFRGKQVAVLAFWASWRAPCLELKPILDGIPRDYRDKDVAFFAINVGETPDEVAAFVAADPSPIAAALDPDSKAAVRTASHPSRRWSSSKDGTIQSARPGRGEDFEGFIRGYLDALLEGKTLAVPPSANDESAH